MKNVTLTKMLLTHRSSHPNRYSTEIGWNGNELKYAAIAAESNVLDPFGQDAESVSHAFSSRFFK